LRLIYEYRDMNLEKRALKVEKRIGRTSRYGISQVVTETLIIIRREAKQ
jgi:hypothetical protein